MKKNSRFQWLLVLCCMISTSAFAQKPPLNHDVYDSWQSVGSANISKDGKVVYFVVSPQEGDAVLTIRDVQKNNLIGTVDRAASVQTSPSGRHLTMLIKPLFSETRQARIDKKRGDDMPKDTLGIFSLTNSNLVKIPAVKSYKLPEEKGNYVVYLADREVAEEPKPADSLASGQEAEARPAGETQAVEEARPGRGARPEGGRAGAANRKKTETLLFLYHLENGIDTTFDRVDTYFISKNGEDLFYVRKAADKDSIGLDAGVFYYHIPSKSGKQISSGKGSYKQLTFDEDGEKVIFLAYKGSDKEQNKVHELYYYASGQDSARVLISQQTPGIPREWQVADAGSLRFTRDGGRILFGIAPVPRLKDTTLVDFEHAKVDIWHWKDDYLQTQQLVNLRRDQNQTYLASYALTGNGRVVPLADEQLSAVRIPDEGSQEYGLGTTDFGRRIESQWMTGTYQDIYLVNVANGERKLVRENVRGSISFSPAGKYVLWFDRMDGNWYAYAVESGRQWQLNQGMNVPFANEDNDSPDEPGAYGIAGWSEGDREVFINDKYDIWAFDMEKGTYRSITNEYGRANRITLRYQNLKPSQRGGGGGRFGGGSDPIDASKALWLNAFNHTSKENGWFKSNPKAGRNPDQIVMAPYRYAQARGAEDVDLFIYTKENYELSPNLYVSKDFIKETQLSNTNPQQAGYNWGTAELFEWTTPRGFAAQGIVYKPEDFDPNKKYPVIAYFYELLSDGLYSYVPPTPTPSRLNISFFVSNGYIVLAPDIHYEIGHPGRSAEEYINSGMKALAQHPWVDAGKLAIQGQSWGGYQVAHLITRTDMYAAAWTGAPVVNMTSAYGGIRWQSGMNRQFQYERTQSRIGATLWEKPELYIENSPLFHLPNVTTPVVIMHNDQDGAVPWYQGIEMFTGLRRLGKPVWMLNYNGDEHNLIQRQNRKDIQRRQQQFFDHFLKGKPAAPWIESGVPAVLKGIDWGFGQ